MISPKDRADAFKAGTLTLEPGKFVVMYRHGEVLVFDAMLQTLWRPVAEQLRWGELAGFMVVAEAPPGDAGQAS